MYYGAIGWKHGRRYGEPTRKLACLLQRWLMLASAMVKNSGTSANHITQARLRQGKRRIWLIECSHNGLPG